MALLAALIALQLGTGRVPRWTDNRWTNWMGERSYAFYLMHVWILFEVIDLVGADAGTPVLFAAMIAMGFPVTLVLAALSWRYVERPFLERRLPWAPGLRPDPHAAHERRDPETPPPPDDREPQPATSAGTP
jgi:peptidoglycan/LPS O-acetylase OafA/YrhL